MTTNARKACLLAAGVAALTLGAASAFAAPAAPPTPSLAPSAPIPKAGGAAPAPRRQPAPKAPAITPTANVAPHAGIASPEPIKHLGQTQAKVGPSTETQPPDVVIPGMAFVRTTQAKDFVGAQGAFKAAGVTKSVYLGEFGGQHLALEGDGIVVLSKETVDENHLHSPIAMPMIPKQISQDACVPTSLAYLQQLVSKDPHVRAVPEGVRSMMMTPLSTSWLTPWGAMFNPVNPAGATAKLQYDLIRPTLTNSGLKFKETSDEAEVFRALEAGKKVFLGVVAATDRRWVTDDRTGAWKVETVLAPYHGGDTGHAMIGLGVVRNASGDRVAVLADPYSGSVVPVKDYNMRDSIQYAFIVDPD